MSGSIVCRASRNVTKCLMKLFFDLSSRKIFHIEAIGTNDMIRPGCTSTRYDGQRIFVLNCVCDNQDYCNNLFTVNEYLEKQPINNKTREIIEINKALRGYLYGTIKVDKLRGSEFNGKPQDGRLAASCLFQVISSLI
ncbi:hypothetical protein NECAME_11945 [Necator americanus]|uniref:Uncharacterized protein n=1 Tax=Necator americanus TaxID=51031 RepID=W2T3D3_NECAM|nr:hypothetical protein NECAME_11945 [Necator americanus]ETN76069.1 hypothetical protein NECAME_11945 [Necator americanus]